MGGQVRLDRQALITLHTDRLLPDGRTVPTRVTFAPGNVPWVIERLESFVQDGGFRRTSVDAQGDELVAKVGGPDPESRMALMNTRGEESAGTIWLSDAEARAALELLSAG